MPKGFPRVLRHNMTTLFTLKDDAERPAHSIDGGGIGFHRQTPMWPRCDSPTKLEPDIAHLEVAVPAFLLTRIRCLG